MEEFLKQCSFPPNVSKGIVEDIFDETDVVEYESGEDFTSKRRGKIKEWDFTEARYSKLQPKN